MNFVTVSKRCAVCGASALGLESASGSILMLPAGWLYLSDRVRTDSATEEQVCSLECAAVIDAEEDPGTVAP